MRKFFLLQIICLLFQASFAGNGVQVSVLTCSPGDEVYALYGHTALRYRDTSRDIDVVFNYGLFDFSTPNFGWRFVLGETDYMVGCTDYINFLPEYSMRGSGVVEQVLDLSDEEAVSLFRTLLLNLEPENRVYRYRYLDNNCTTKVRDKLLEVLSKSGEVVYKNDSLQGETYRDALNAPADENPWYAFGINLLLGADVDKVITHSEGQFLPNKFMNDLEGAYVVSADGAERKLVCENNVLLAPREKVVARNNLTPFNVSLLLLLATFVTMLCELRKRKTYWGVDVMLMLLQGLSGSLLLFMALFSEHPAVDSNYLILLLNPLALVLMPLLVYRIIKKKSVKIVWLQVAFVALFLLSAVVGIQTYPAPVYFFAAAILFRSMFHLYKNNICELNIF